MYKQLGRQNKSHNQDSKRIFFNEDSLRDLWDNMKFTNIHIIGIPEGEEREKEVENVFDEIMAENFPNLKKETNVQVQEAQGVPDQDEPTQTHTKMYN